MLLGMGVDRAFIMTLCSPHRLARFLSKNAIVEVLGPWCVVTNSKFFVCVYSLSKIVSLGDFVWKNQLSKGTPQSDLFKLKFHSSVSSCQLTWAPLYCTLSDRCVCEAPTMCRCLIGWRKSAFLWLSVFVLVGAYIDRIEGIFSNTRKLSVDGLVGSLAQVCGRY